MPALASGAVLIKQVRTNQYVLTFVATGLPDPSTLGDFDSYIGSIVMIRGVPGRAHERPPILTFSAVLGPSQVLEQPITWSGSRIIPERPQPEDFAQIQPFNFENDIRGAALMTGNLRACRG